MSATCSTSSRNWKHEPLYLFRRDKKKIVWAKNVRRLFTTRSVSRKSRQLMGRQALWPLQSLPQIRKRKFAAIPHSKPQLNASNANKIGNVGVMEFLSVNHNKHSQNIKKRFARRFQNFQGIMFDYRLWLLLTRARFAESELKISGTKALD